VLSYKGEAEEGKEEIQRDIVTSGRRFKTRGESQLTGRIKWGRDRSRVHWEVRGEKKGPGGEKTDKIQNFWDKRKRETPKAGKQGKKPCVRVTEKTRELSTAIGRDGKNIRKNRGKRISGSDAWRRRGERKNERKVKKYTKGEKLQQKNTPPHKRNQKGGRKGLVVSRLDENVQFGTG